MQMAMAFVTAMRLSAVKMLMLVTMIQPQLIQRPVSSLLVLVNLVMAMAA
jgi:hypothetical protein